MKKLIILFIVLAAFGVKSYAQVGQASARIIKPITIAYVRTLAFGDLAELGGGDVTIANTSSGTSVAGGAGVKVVASNTSTSAQFTVTGDPNATFAVSLPADGVAFVQAAGTPTAKMYLKAFATDIETKKLAVVTGTQTIYVGATLTVPASATVDTYSGTFAVTVAYN